MTWCRRRARLVLLLVILLGLMTSPGLAAPERPEPLPLLAIEAGNGAVDAGGIPVYYEWTIPAGQNTDLPAVVLIHGLGGSGRMWFGNVFPLAQAGYRVYTPDLPGFGYSGLPQETISVLNYAYYLAHFLDALGEQRVILVGSSLGGYIAWHFASMHPDRVEALVLADAAGLPIKEPLTPGLARLKPLLTSYRRLTWLYPGVDWLLNGDGHERLVRSVARRFIDMGFADSGRMTPEVFESSYESARNSRILIYGRLDFEAPPVNYRESLLGIRVPTLIVWGGNDQVIPVEDAETFAGLIPGSQVVILDGVGHLPMQEVPDEFNRVVGDFLWTLMSPDGSDGLGGVDQPDALGLGPVTD